MKCVTAAEAYVVSPLDTLVLETSIPCSVKIDDEHENVFAVIL